MDTINEYQISLNNLQLHNKISAVNLQNRMKIATVVDVEFGSPMKNCLHYGICRVTVPSANAAGHCPCRCLAVIQNFGDGLVQFVFDRNKMPGSVFIKYFKSGFFQVDDGYKIPTEVSSKIGRKEFVIKAGKYPILLESDLFKIVF